jgi:hypothetical protein
MCGTKLEKRGILYEFPKRNEFSKDGEYVKLSRYYNDKFLSLFPDSDENKIKTFREQVIIQL